MAADHSQMEPIERNLLTGAVMLAVFLQVLDTTIANVALPHMQAALGATQESINWVLTSYIVASAIAIPISGWLADRVGRKELLIVAVIGFTIASFLCAIAQSLTEMVLFRIIQGITGAFLVPLSQATLFDINPPERHARAMALFGGGIMIGPIMGPLIGGWLTDTFDWRWVFLVNLPVGALAIFMLWRFLPDLPLNKRRFDLFGFALIAVALGSLQLMLDRGQQLDWFESAEVMIEAGLALGAFWMFVVHVMTAKEPLFERRMFADRNLSTGLLFMAVLGVLLNAGLSLLPPLLQSLYGYSVLQSGALTMPRGVGTLITMVGASRLAKHVDIRILIATGMGLMAYSLHMMTQFSLDQGREPVIASGLVQGLGLGMLFATIPVVAFGTLAPRFRTAGSSVLNLSRNIGGSAGISVVSALLARNMQVSHADLAQHFTDQRLPSSMAAVMGQIGLSAQTAMAALNGEITRQASFIAFLDDFYFMMWVTLAAIPLVLLLRPSKVAQGGEPAMAMD